MRTLLFLGFLFMVPFACKSQSRGINYHAIYLNVGGIILPCLGCEGGEPDGIGNLQGTFESSRGNPSSSARYTVGLQTRNGDPHLQVSWTGVLLTGKKKNHFEFDYGIMYSRAIDPSVLPIVNLGYRYQDFENTGFILRLGMGLEQIGFYLSMGKVF